MISLDAGRSLRQAIDDQARRLGFSLIGVTTPDPPPHFQVYKDWLEAGRHAEMHYLAGERALHRRADPRHILPECRSILLLGIRYPAPNTISLQSSATADAENTRLLTGRMAAYAWGEDYHHVLVERLRALTAFIESWVGRPVPNRLYTDTGPVLERDLAQRAGLGWVGKNTCLINPKGGSYYFLAEVLLGIELAPDSPFSPDRCGNCTRCLDACPTSCILPDRTIDSRNCISYLTIELKGAIPVDLRPLIGNWIFGCDICQQVCPWNQRFAVCPGDPVFAPHNGMQRPDLTAEIQLTPQEFNRKYKGSPVKRAKRRGYLRNVAVALGNGGSQAAVPVLQWTLINEEEPLVRGHAAWALGQIGGEHARRALLDADSQEMNAFVREEINGSLGKLWPV